MKIKVRRKGNFGHSFVGSEVNSLLKHENVTVITNLIRLPLVYYKDNQSMVFCDSAFADDMEKLMIITKVLFDLCTAPRLLQDSEIVTIHVKCIELYRLYTSKFSYTSFTPKLHNLIFHFPLFASKYKTIALFGEQGMESVHTVFNTYDRIYCAIKYSLKQLENNINLHNLKSNITLNNYILQ